MEDYKTKYEHALDNFKKIKDANKDNNELINFIEYEYPELKESKDERIRKEIINTFKTLGDGKIPVDINYADIFTWLEKQGKQKSNNKVEQEEDVELTDFESALFSAFSDAWQEYLSGEEINVAKWAKEHSAELLEVAREQNTAWNEDDKLKMDTLIHVITNQRGSAIFEGFLPEELVNWLKSLKERMKGK